MKHKKDCELMTVSFLIHAIANLNADFLYSELPVLYEIAFEKMKGIKKWDRHSMDHIKLLWNAMAITQIYHMSMIVKDTLVFE